MDLVSNLKSITGKRWVLSGDAATRSYRTGYRVGFGEVLAVARPGNLVELWRTVEASIAARCIVILQAANTGLTGGSTPYGEYDRPVVLVSTDRLSGIILLGAGEEAICYAGSTLTELESAIAPLGRVPHSVIGSSCIGASVIGGICNNSGGALVQRGPAFTESALFAQVTAAGRLELVNHLGFDLPDDPLEALALLDRRQADLPTAAAPPLAREPYADHVRQLDQPTPARFNADGRSLFEASGSAGKLVVFAVRVPTYPAGRRQATFVVGTDNGEALAQLRRRILRDLPHLPTVGEYVHRDAAALAISHGNDVCVALRLLGEARMPAVSAFQRRLDSLGRKVGTNRDISAWLGQWLGRSAPHPLPPRMRAFFGDHQHLLLLKADDDAIGPLRALLERMERLGDLDLVETDAEESTAAFRVRFAVAAATVRYAAVERGAGALAALDIALPRNAADWSLRLPDALARLVLVRADYGHFLCHVFHLDFVLRPGVDRNEFEHAVKRVVEERGGRMPAEHNFGHLYEAPGDVVRFYRLLDPTNSLNPGIGKTSRARDWREA